jgi:putative hemolysin
MGTLTEVGVIALLIVINALFITAEYALITVRRSRVQQLIEEGHRGARRVHRLVSQPGRFLAVIQLGTTFVGFLAAAFAGASVVGTLQLALQGVPIVGAQAALVALLVVTLIISVVTIVFGELLPRTIALAHAERFALIFAGPVELFGRIFSPLVWFLTTTTAGVTRLLGLQPAQPERMTAEELRILVERGGEQGVIEAEEQQMIGAVLELGEQRVHEVMVPRIDIKAVQAAAPLEEFVETFVREGHSRIPVYEESIDNIIGILYAKDLLPYLARGESPAISSILRTPLFVPESITIDDLLHNFQRRKVHIAIVLDEYGGTAGLVTIEDLIEEIVGEIQDEYDTEEPMIVPVSDDRALVDGRAGIDDLAEHFDIQLNGADSQQYDTVGGLVYHEIGGVPCPLPEPCEWVNVPLLSSFRSHWIQPSDQRPEATASRYLEMIEQGLPSIGRILRLFVESPWRPTLIHCTAGRDRTGIVIAFLLDLLEVSEEVIAADYALSDGATEDGARAQGETMLHLLELIRKQHTSTREMLLRTGVTSRYVDQLRDLLLESVSGGESSP